LIDEKVHAESGSIQVVPAGTGNSSTAYVTGSDKLGECDINSLPKAVCNCLPNVAQAAYTLFEGEMES